MDCCVGKKNFNVENLVILPLYGAKAGSFLLMIF